MVDLGGQKKTSATKDSIWGTASRPLHILADYIEGQMSLENKRLRETLRTYIGHEERYNGIINQMLRGIDPLLCSIFLPWKGELERRQLDHELVWLAVERNLPFCRLSRNKVTKDIPGVCRQSIL